MLENGVWKKEEGVDYRDIEIGFLDGIDDEARSRAIIMHYDSEGGFSIEYKIEGIRFNCLPVEISNSGIAFQFNGIDVRFSEGERGIFFNEVNIFFGSHLSFVPDGLSLTDGSITEMDFAEKSMQNGILILALMMKWLAKRRDIFWGKQETASRSG